MDTQPICQDTTTACLKIYTLGRFSVRFGDRVLSDETRRSRKLWRLFAYLFQNQDKEVPTETLADCLWPEEGIADPQGALHNLVYRLRRIFEGLRCGEPPVTINYSQVGYVLRLGPQAWSDVGAFTGLLRRASSVLQTDPAGAIETYREALALYRGDYLPGRSHEPWVVFAGRHYRRAYVDALEKLIELLRRPARFAEIVEVCEDAFSMGDFLDAEEIHCRFMEALAKQGRAVDALDHYEMVSKRLHAAYGRKPSEMMQSLNMVIRGQREELQAQPVDLQLSTIRQLLVGVDDIEGAYLCDRDAFRSILCLNDRQRNEHTGQKSFLGLLTVARANGQRPDETTLTGAMDALRTVLIANLRQGDIMSQ